MAPHNTPGQRFDNLPTVDPSGKVVATHPGVYLFQIRLGDEYIVGRLQVHQQIVAWWFGNDSITTAKHEIAHAQPSIYAKFSDDPTGTDLIGDITGHGYVQFTSGNTSQVEVRPFGRLRGLAETSAPVTLSGTFSGQTNTLPVRVVDYAKHRRDLDGVQVPDLAHAQSMHNIVFVAEGFTEAHRDVFNDIVTNAVTQIFDEERHQPYAMLEGSFNIFKAFTASQQHAVTCGFRVADSGLAKGSGPFIPDNNRVSEKANAYTLEQLIRIVGLPKRGEDRQNLPAVWGAQSLTNLDPARVDEDLVSAWRTHQSVGILHARDTFFGMHLGARWADRASQTTTAINPIVIRPANDTPGDPLKAFVARVYEFYTTSPTRALTPDPRRHPPELQAGGYTNPAVSLMDYLKGLDYAFSPFPNIGLAWAPDDADFKPSRGLVALVVHDGLFGGSNLNKNTLTAVTLDRSERASFVYGADKREMRREPPAKIKPETQHVVDTIAHEFGHSFNLLDEYEEFDGDDKSAEDAGDLRGDNVTRLRVVRLGAAPGRDIDPSKVKWFDLLRMRASDRLIAPSQLVGANLKVTIDKRYMGPWVRMRQLNEQVHLRNFKVGPQGQQLPLAAGPAQYLTGLRIVDHDAALGTITLTGPQLPPAGVVFGIGSALFVPEKDTQGNLITVVEKKVLDHLNSTHTVLNQDTGHALRNPEADHPVSIPGFKAPCKSSRLIGIYEGGATFAGADYRPSGQCKMRTKEDTDQGGEFCFVCKWLIVNRVDPGYHSIISARFYPEAKKNG
ncbi:hypothetical protein ACPYPG_33980 [Streptomyces sp. FR-108]|uniref:hypothetical protein n=1 Tax=Streptomyces sp. FR-108 TaxID=3416665 RepID=UPI003CECFB5D